MTLDLTDFSMTHTGTTVPVAAFPVIDIQCRVVNAATRAVLRDFTGINAVQFPQLMTTLTAAQRRRVLEAAIRECINIKLEEAST